MLAKNIHYKINTINKTIILNQQLNYDCEYYIYEQIPIGENSSLYKKNKDTNDNEIFESVMKALNDKFVVMSFEEYNSLTTKDNNKIYLITRSNPI